MAERKVIGNKAIALVAFVFCAALGSVAADEDMPGVAPAPAGGWKSRGMVIAAPMPKDVGRFCSFIKDTLKPAGVDTLVLLVRYRYQFASHPECVMANAISLADAKAIKAACDAADMRLIPKMNLLGHQSGNKVYAGLLKGHPELDESPEKEQVARNYCRSICPTHPDSKRIVCEMLDELVAAFGADMVHIGCDEVFEIGNCPRCRGTATAKLFADWVNGIAAHLKEKGVGMMMWGDRLLDSKAMGYGVWEASDNGTSAALGKVSKDVVICDWHYESKKAYPSVEVFADAGYKIYLCPWRYAENAQKFLAYAVAHDKGQYLGFLFTTWCACEDLMDVLEGKGVTRHQPDSKGAKTLVALRRNFRYLFPAAKGTTPSTFDATLTDPLAWLYADSKVASAERLDEIDVPANGVIDANILVNGLKPGEPLEVVASACGEWYRMRAVPVKRNTGVRGFLEKKPGDNPHVARRAPFEVFDVLEPLDRRVKDAAPYLIIPDSKETEALRFRMDRAPEGAKSFEIRFSVKQGAETRELALKVNVHNVSLPPVGKDSFKYTNWMDFGSMAGSHGIKPWSEEHWKMIEKYVRLAARGRQNMGMMRDVFMHSADGTITFNRERFARLLEMYDRVGFWYLEGGHLASFTAGWGSPAFKTSYTTNVTTTVQGALALSRLARMYMEEIEARGLKDRWYQHVADEPGGKNVPEYRITAGIIRRYMPGIRTVDAVEEPSFAGALDVWCPKVDAFERHRALYDSFRTNFGDRVWCYTCCIPGGKWMNRTMDGELLRPALIPWVSVMFDVDGFLHWGYNRWQRGQGQDPFKEPYPKKWGGSNDGHSLPPGDTHIVYPGKDGPWPSARLEATRAGMEDADLLTMLRRRDKARADGLVRRIARGFSDYTPSCKLYREVRRDILRALER